MITDLTPFERRLAHRLPCTAATFVAWYSRNWRTWDTRGATIFHAALLAALLLGVALIPSHPMAQKGALHPSTAFSACACLLSAAVGAVQGGWVIARCRRRLAMHWLASALTPLHIANEMAAAAMLKVLGALSLCWMAFGLTGSFHALPFSSMLAASAAYLLGYASGCGFRARTRARSLAGSERTRRLPNWPRLAANARLQAGRPATLLLTVIAVVVLSGLLGGVALAGGTRGPLIMAAVVAAVGWICCIAQLTPGAAASHALLAWTGIASHRIIARLLLFPCLIAVLLAAPAIVTGVFLAPMMGLALALIGLALSTLVALIRVVADLHAVRGRSSTGFIVIQTIAIGLLVILGPLSLLLYPLHVYWLIRKAHRFWTIPL